MDITTYIVVVILQGLVCGAIAAGIGSEKGRSKTTSFIYGFSLSFIGVIIVALLPLNEDVILEMKYKEGKKKKCPYCSEYVSPEVTIP